MTEIPKEKTYCYNVFFFLCTMSQDKKLVNFISSVISAPFALNYLLNHWFSSREIVREKLLKILDLFPTSTRARSSWISGRWLSCLYILNLSFINKIQTPNTSTFFFFFFLKRNTSTFEDTKYHNLWWKRNSVASNGQIFVRRLKNPTKYIEDCVRIFSKRMSLRVCLLE